MLTITLYLQKFSIFYYQNLLPIKDSKAQYFLWLGHSCTSLSLIYWTLKIPKKTKVFPKGETIPIAVMATRIICWLKMFVTIIPNNLSTEDIIINIADEKKFFSVLSFFPHHLFFVKRSALFSVKYHSRRRFKQFGSDTRNHSDTNLHPSHLKNIDKIPIDCISPLLHIIFFFSITNRC